FPIAYPAHPSLLKLLSFGRKLQSVSPAYDGIITTDNQRFIRYWWECGVNTTAVLQYAKGGDTRRWKGLEYYCILWCHNGIRLKRFVEDEKHHSHWSRKIS